jgi:Flp pilus assembly protein TadG
MRTITNRFSSRQYTRGQAMAEFSLVATAALIMIFALINCSLVIYDYNFVSYAAREATRYAAVRGSSSSSPANNTNITNYVIGEAAGLDPSKVSVSTTWSPNNSPGSAVEVQVQYPFTLSIPFLVNSTVNLSSTSQLVITQ